MMQNTHQGTFRLSAKECRGSLALLRAVALFFVGSITGCTALTNPLVDAVPVRHVAPELLGESREGRKTVALQTLRRKRPDVYRLAPGDTLGIWIEDVFGTATQPPPTYFSERTEQAPSFGYPIPIRADGTISLPLMPVPIPVAGKTVADAEELIRRYYTGKEPGSIEVLKPGHDRLLVTLQRQHVTRVLVIRQDTGGSSVSATSTGAIGALGGTELLGSSKRGTGSVVELSGDDNDVLTALARSGGLPGLDALNEVIIEHSPRAGRGAALDKDVLDALPPGTNAGGGKVTRIPLRLRPGEPLPFRQEDVELNTGDIVFIEAREAEVFYTGGILPSAEHVLPRDYDLTALEAIARTRGSMFNGGLTTSNLSGTAITTGIGNPNPSLLTILRRTHGGGRMRIRVDLNRAARDPRENILILPKDILVLQETPGEAFGRYISEMFKLDFVGRIIKKGDVTLTSTATVP